MAECGSMGKDYKMKCQQKNCEHNETDLFIQLNSGIYKKIVCIDCFIKVLEEREKNARANQ